MDELDKILTETIVSLADEMKREVETPGLIRVPIKGRIAKIRKAIDAHYEAKTVEARIDEVRSIKNGFDEYKSNGFETNQTIDELTDQMVARLTELKKEKH